MLIFDLLLLCGKNSGIIDNDHGVMRRELESATHLYVPSMYFHLDASESLSSASMISLTIAVVVPCEVGAGSSEARNWSSEVLITLVVGERVGGAVGVAVLSGILAFSDEKQLRNMMYIIRS